MILAYYKQEIILYFTESIDVQTSK